MKKKKKSFSIILNVISLSEEQKKKLVEYRRNDYVTYNK